MLSLASQSLRSVGWMGGLTLVVVLVPWWWSDVLCSPGELVLCGSDIASDLDRKDLWPNFLWILPNHGFEGRVIYGLRTLVVSRKVMQVLLA